MISNSGKGKELAWSSVERIQVETHGALVMTETVFNRIQQVPIGHLPTLCSIPSGPGGPETEA